MLKRHLEISTLIVLIIFLVGPLVFAFPNFINYQGKLTDSSDNLLNGDYLLTFKIFSVETEGEPLWTEQETLTVTNGIYNVELGAVNPFPADLFETEMLYLEVIILNPDTGTDETLSPRIPFTSTGFSMKAKDAYTAGDADTVDGFHAEDFASTNHTHSFSEITDTATDNQIPDDITINFAASAGDADKLDGKDSREFGDGHSLDAADGSSIDVVYVDNEGNVGIGTTNPWAKLALDGDLYVGSHLVGGQGIRIEGTGIEAVGTAVWQNLYLSGSGISGHEGGNVILQKDGGNVGIGTEEPREKLEINGNLLFTEAGVTRSIYVKKSDGIDEPGSDLEIYAGECNAQMIETMKGGNLRLHGGRGYWPSGGDVYMYGGDTGDDTDPRKLGNIILAHNGKVSGGNVGIGTTSPKQKMHISGVMRLEPQSSPPSGALGDLYVGMDGKLYFHNGTEWKEVSLVDKDSVFRARTSEGIATLGAIKTYMIERANATGRWPNKNQLMDEFNNFTELYYFDRDSIDLKPHAAAFASEVNLVPITTTPHIAIELTVNPDNFGIKNDPLDTLQLDIDLEDTDNNGWSGTVRKNWAEHLPVIDGTPLD